MMRLKLYSLTDEEHSLVRCSILFLAYCNYANHGCSINAVESHRSKEGGGREIEREEERKPTGTYRCDFYTEWQFRRG